jgi:hypothetical protein
VVKKILVKSHFYQDKWSINDGISKQNKLARALLRAQHHHTRNDATSEKQ